MSYAPITFSDPVMIMARRRQHYFQTFPDPVLIVCAYDGILSHGRPIYIYVSGIEGLYSAVLGELHATTQISHIFRIDNPVPPLQWYLSFSHQARQVYHFPGHIYVIHSAEQEEDYELWVMENYELFFSFFMHVFDSYGPLDPVNSQMDSSIDSK